jgi:hypothetical protein
MKKKLGELVTIGYTEPNALGRIDAFVAQPRAYVVDIRYKPWSKWNSNWSRNMLSARYPKRYIHLPGLGNVNYGQKQAAIQLADPERHIRHLAEMLQHGCSYLLLCACKDYAQCHRKVVYELILAAMGQPVSVVPSQPVYTVQSLWEG